MIKNKFNVWRLSAAIGLVYCGAMLPVAGVSLSDLAGSKNERANKATTINSDMMDIDFQNNLTVFNGNVFVDDPQLTIKCDKMMIYLRDKTSDKSSSPSKKKDLGNSLNAITPGGSGKELDKVVCTGKVVIVRKVMDKEEAKGGEQKAEAGKAVYDFRENTICLTEDNPKVTRGANGFITGSRITLWLDSERVKVESNDKPVTLEIHNVGDLNKEVNGTKDSGPKETKNAETRP